MKRKLTKNYLEEKKEKLLTEKAEVEAELAKFIAEDKDEERLASQDEDNATELSNYEDRKALEDELIDSLKKLNKALKKIDDGVYGICETCGKPIPKNRLKAFPAAENCIKDC